MMDVDKNIGRKKNVTSDIDRVIEYTTGKKIRIGPYLVL